MKRHGSCSVRQAAARLGIGVGSRHVVIPEGRLRVSRTSRRPRLRVPLVAIEELLKGTNAQGVAGGATQ